MYLKYIRTFFEKVRKSQRIYWKKSEDLLEKVRLVVIIRAQLRQ
jgi:hypothetical protein